MLQSRFRILRHEIALWDLRDIVHVNETCVILRNMLVRIAQNNLFGNEGFCNEYTKALVEQFYDADLACVGADVVPAAHEGVADCDTDNSDDDGRNTGGAAHDNDMFKASFSEMFAKEKLMTSESEHTAIRTELTSVSSSRGGHAA